MTKETSEPTNLFWQFKILGAWLLFIPLVFWEHRPSTARSVAVGQVLPATRGLGGMVGVLTLAILLPLMFFVDGEWMASPKSLATFTIPLTVYEEVLFTSSVKSETIEGLQGENAEKQQSALRSIVPVNLQNRSLIRSDMRKVLMPGANLTGAQLQEAMLQNAQLQGAILIEAELRGADLRDAQLQYTNLRGTQFQNADLSGAQLQRADLSYKQSHKNTEFGDAPFYKADLSGAQLQGANLQNGQLRGANLYNAQLQGANLSNAKLLGANMQGVDLRGANLMGAQIGNAQGAQLQYADLRGAQLGNADLRGAQLQGALLQDADLRGAQLEGADLRGAQLGGAMFEEGDLRGAILESPELRAANVIKYGTHLLEALTQLACESSYIASGIIHSRVNIPAAAISGLAQHWEDKLKVPGSTSDEKCASLISLSETDKLILKELARKERQSQ